HMIIELLGQTEADDLAGRIIQRVVKAGLRGNVFVRVPDDFDLRTLNAREAWEAALAAITLPGDLNIELPGGLRLEGEVFAADGYAIAVNDWQDQMKNARQQDARLYSQARAVSRTAVDPIELQMTGPRRTGRELVEYLWERKFDKAASQCSGARGAILVFEWAGIDDASIFRD